MTATPQFDETPQGYLAEADKNFDAGDRFEGSKYVWLATQAAIAAFAERRGLPCGNDDEAFEVILTLELQNGRDYDHTGAYGIAQGFRDNSQKPGKYDTSLDLNHWDEQGFALRRPIAAEFVNYIVEKTPTKGAIPQGRKTPREYLYEAEKRFYAGDKKEGSKYTWLATLTAIAAIAEQRGLPCRNYDEARNVVRALKDGGDSALEYGGGMSVAQGFLDNAQIPRDEEYDLSLYHWDDEEFAAYRPEAEEFIDYLSGKVAGAPAGQ